MSGITVACPGCSKLLQLPSAPLAGARLRCPACAITFTCGNPVQSAPPIPQQPTSPPPARGFALGLLVGILIVVGGGAGVAVYVSRNAQVRDTRQTAEIPKETPPATAGKTSDDKDDHGANSRGKPADTGKKDRGSEKPKTTGESPVRPDRYDPAVKPKDDGKPKDPPREDPKPKDPPREDPKPKDPPRPNPSVARDLPPDLQTRVNDAIERGLGFLKGSQEENGTWVGDQPLGVTALAALTLLECGVRADAPEVQKAVAFVRKEAPKISPKERTTYQASLIILLLDRLGDAKDEALIQSLAVRLLANQAMNGGWYYGSPVVLKEEEEQGFLLVLRHTRPVRNVEAFMSGPGGFAPETAGMNLVLPGRNVDPNAPFRGVVLPSQKADEKTEAARRAYEALPLEARKVPALTPPSLHPPFKNFEIDPATTDNSNTQFAMLALQAAGRHNVPTERALARCVLRFRAVQQSDGSWCYPYTRSAWPGTPSMTCAGLIALAIGHALLAPAEPKMDERGRVKDPRVGAGLVWVSQVIGSPLDKPVEERTVLMDPRALTLYFLWSLERVGVLYSLPKINGKDWYRWGAEMLTKTQTLSGSWELKNYPGSTEVLDTCFALLFLKRANLAKDVTLKIQNKLELLEEDRPKR